MALTVTITDNLSGTANRSTASVTYALAFSEAVTGLEAGDFTVSNGTVSSVSGSGSAWSVNVTPTLGVAGGSIGLTLKAGAVSDGAGNLNALTTNSSQALDTLAPVAPKLVTNAAFNSVVDPQVTMQTSLGSVVLALNPEAAPVTVANMLAYVNSGFYDGTLFHRVIPNFMVQGGGYTSGLTLKTPTYGAITLESNNGLSNLRGTIAMARTNAPNSATTQFFVNQVDNLFLNYSSAASPGYAVFGKVLSGLAVIDAIVSVPTITIGPFANVPASDVTITSMTQSLAGSMTSSAATLTLGGLEAGAPWSYSLDGGASWSAGAGTSLTLAPGAYAAGAIQVRQSDAAGNLSASAGQFSSALRVESPGQIYTGTAGADSLSGSAGSDIFDGAGGLDTVNFSSRAAAYTLLTRGTYRLAGPDGTDALSSVERLHFLDANLGLDLDGSAGQVYRLYKAAFARTPDLAGLGNWIKGMDDGLSLEQVAAAFSSSAEFQSLYGSNTSHQQFVTLLYLNALGRAPEAGGVNAWAAQLAIGVINRAQLLAQFSESAENQQAVLGSIANGILFATAEQAAGPAQGQSFTGSSGADSLLGSVGNDSFTGGLGNDSINGGAGLDLALYSGDRASYTLSANAGILTVAGGTDGSDTLSQVERIRFADTALAFDTGGNAGQTYRLYQAAFDRTPDLGGLSDWMRGMDGGMTLAQVATGFIASAEFQGLYGASPSDQAFVTLLYQNVLNRAPDAGGQAYWLDELGRGLTREMALIGFSESVENQATLMGVMQGGIEYLAG